MKAIWCYPSAVLALAAAVSLIGARPVGAAVICGGKVPCACGNTVKGTAVLAADLGVCTGIGLAITSGAVLDCAGHTITGSDKPGAWYGLKVDSATGATVRNCKVTLFRRGIRIRGGSNNVITGNESFRNRYGIDVAAATTLNRIESNSVHDNRDEGIHLGTGANQNTILNNQLVHNKNENLYLLEVQGSTVSGNQISRGGKAAIYVKHSDNNTFSNNTLSDGPAHVRGDSSGNVFTGNHLTGAGYFFEAYQDPTTLVWTFPHDNSVDGGWIKRAANCFRFFGAYDNHATQVGTDGACVPALMGPLGGQEPTGNTVDLVPVQ
jgi:parallel beta-helix repeat protein